MPASTELRLDAASALSLGARQDQEDAVLCDVPRGGGAGILVLSDGLGGHVAGSVASRLAVAVVLDELNGLRDSEGRLGRDIPGHLVNAAQAANHAILAHSDSNPETAGMGATLLIVVVERGRLHWLSIGDSPFYLFREGRLRQLNEVHSLAPQFDLLARAGEMPADVAAHHPDRSCLTSALGLEPLRQIDCPETGLDLSPGDLLLAASDGILTLSEQRIGAELAAASMRSAPDLAEMLLRRVEAEDADEQDNLSLAVLRILAAPSEARACTPRRRIRGRFSGFGLPSPAVLWPFLPALFQAGSDPAPTVEPGDR